MKKITISAELLNNYQKYYEEEDLEWRRLGSIGKVDNIFSLCSNLPRNSILDIGAGEGSILKKLSEMNFGNELYAIEISQSGVNAITNKRIPRLVECKLFDGYNIPYNDKRFDIAILSHVIEHVEHPRYLIYEASRVAKYIFVEVPLEDTIRLSDNFVFDIVGHINFYSMKTIRRLLQSCNLTVINEIITNSSKDTYTYQEGPKGTVHYFIKQFLLNIAPNLAIKLFCYHGALVCGKISL
jgi:ubiquinone/menaquinone biosynthesis C-methylase UbiE